MDNKSKSEQIYDLLPRLLNAKNDANWSGLVNAIGAEDDRLAQLVEDVREQFFVKTASRPYLDRLAANHNITRPKFLGMSDSSFRSYIPVIAYQPKQVKQIVDTLLDVFFLKEATTAFVSSSVHEPFVLQDGWELLIQVDRDNAERIVFRSADFSSISGALADEVVAVYNRQARFSYAVTFFDSNTEQTYIRIFSNTTGSQGSLQIVGGLANIGLKLNGFITTAGNGTNTQWTVSKVGDRVTFTYTGGAAPGLDQLQIGDIALSQLSENAGSFAILDINPAGNSFTVSNLFGTAKVITQNSSDELKFTRPDMHTPYLTSRRALAWETTAGKISVEMPTTPAVVERGLKGGFHLNGVTSLVVSFDSSNSLTVEDASLFPASGQFVIEPGMAITAKLAGNNTTDVVTYSVNGRLISNLVRYTYAGISGNTLTGISPTLPAVAGLIELSLTNLTRTGGVVTCAVNNSLNAGDVIVISGSSGIDVASVSTTTTSGSSTIVVADSSNIAINQLVRGTGIPSNTKVLGVSGTNVTINNPADATGTATITFSEDTNGAFEVQTASATNLTYDQLGSDGTAVVAGTLRCEKLALDPSNSKVVLTTATSSGVKGSYVWDPKAPFVLSSNVATTTVAISSGKSVNLLAVSSNTIPSEAGYCVLDYGQNTQEGPIKVLYKPNPNVLVLDPSYVFKYDHDIGSTLTMLSHRGPHEMSGKGAEYAPYLTDPVSARLLLEQLIKSVTSAGIFVDFLIRYPSQLYGALSVYEGR